MLFKTKGIVLNYIKYRETSIIVKIYTERFGIQSYIVNSVRSKSSKPKIALYQPLTLLDLVVYHKGSVDIHRISEVRQDVPLVSIPFQFRKSCIAIFLTEILMKTLREESENPSLFNFLHYSILSLDQIEKGYENFHIQFLLGLTIYLGFAPETAEEIFLQLKTDTSRVFQLKSIVESFMSSNYSTPVVISGLDRREVLEILLRFYQLHIENFGELRSLEVLKETMN